MSKDLDKPDIEVEITNGKTVRVNLSPLEWVIVLTGLSVLVSMGSWIAGVI